jgi:hypothetical protein
MGLDLADRNAAGVVRDDFVVKAASPGLVFGKQLGLEGTVPVTRNLDGKFAELALEGFVALAVARVADNVSHRLMLVVTKLLGQFSIQRHLHRSTSSLVS